MSTFYKPRHPGLRIRMPDRQMQHLPSDGADIDFRGSHGAYYRRLKREGDIVPASRKTKTTSAAKGGEK